MKPLLYIFITFIALSVTSCKKWQHKYPEDTERSKDTPFERLTNKWWTLKTASINGIDFTDSVNKVFGKYQVYFGSSVYQYSSSGIPVYNGLISSNIEPVFSSVWSLVENETILGIGPLLAQHNEAFNVLPGFHGDIKFEKYAYSLLKLTDTNLKMKIATKGNDTTIITQFIR